LANRFEARRGGFADLAVASRKQPKTFLDDIERIMDWKPIESFLKKKLRRHQDAVGNPAHPYLSFPQPSGRARFIGQAVQHAQRAA
jgi:hypothetical protein